MPKKVKTKKSKNLSDFSIEKKAKSVEVPKEKPSEIKSEEFKKGRKFLNRKTIYVIVVVLAIALFLTLVFLSVELEIIKNPFRKFGAIEERYIIRDRCSMILGNLIHPIEDEDSCEQVCHSNCDVRDKKFIRFEFTPSQEDCNECVCYCK